MTATEFSLPKKRCLIRPDREAGTFSIRPLLTPVTKDKRPEDPFRFKPYSTTFFSKFKRAFNAEDTIDIPKYPLGGSFAKNSSISIVGTENEQFSDCLSYRYNKDVVMFTFGSDQSEEIRLDSLAALMDEDFEVSAVDSIQFFGRQYLVIAAYCRDICKSNVILHDLVFQKSFILPIGEVGHIAHLAISLLDDTSLESSYLPVKPKMSEIILTLGLTKPGISSHIFTISEENVKGKDLSIKHATSFKYVLCPNIKLTCVESWVIQSYRSILIGFGTAGGSQQLLLYKINSAHERPSLAKALSFPLSGFSKASCSLAPVTWLSLKASGSDLMLMIGQGSKIYESSSNPMKPSFSLVRVSRDLSSTSLVYSHQSEGDEPGAFAGASLFTVGDVMHLDFAYWQGSTIPKVTSFHLTRVQAGSFKEGRNDSLTLAAGDIPLNFQSNQFLFRLLTSEGVKQHQFLATCTSTFPFTSSDFFLNKCQSLTGELPSPLKLVEQPFLKNFFIGEANSALVVPSTDSNELMHFIKSNVVSVNFEDLVFCYCLLYICEASAREFCQRYLSSGSFDLLMGYFLIDRGCISQGIDHIILSNIQPHYPQELLDLVLLPVHQKSAALLWTYVKPCPKALTAKDPLTLIRGLFSFGLNAVHQFLNSYTGTTISREDAFWTFYREALSDKHFLTFTRYVCSHVLTPEEEGYFNTFLKSKGLALSTLANGLLFLINYLYDCQRFEEALALFYSNESVIQKVCSPNQNDSLVKVITCASLRSKESPTIPASKNPVRHQRACFIEKHCTQREVPSFSDLPLFTLLCNGTASIDDCFKHSVTLVTEKSQPSRPILPKPLNAFELPDHLTTQLAEVEHGSTHFTKIDNASARPAEAICEDSLSYLYAASSNYNGSTAFDEIIDEGLDNSIVPGDLSQSFCVLPTLNGIDANALSASVSQESQASNSLASTPEPSTPNIALKGKATGSNSSAGTSQSNHSLAESNEVLIDVRRESNVSLPNQTISPNNSIFNFPPPQSIQDTSASGHPISQLWPPLGERFPDCAQNTQERFPNFITEAKSANSRTEEPESDDSKEANGYNTRSKSKKSKKN